MGCTNQPKIKLIEEHQMFARPMILATFLTVSLFVLAACGGAPAAAPAEPTSEPVAEATQVPAEEEAAEAPAEAESAAEVPADEASAAAGTRTFVVVPDQSTASFLVDEEFLGGALDKLGIAAGKSDVVGSTQEVSGQFELDLDTGAIAANEFTVQIDTLSTDQSRRDNWVREQAPGFAKFPTAVFVASSIENAPGEYSDGEEVTFQLSGDLSVRDVAVPITFNVTATLDGDTITGVALADSLLSDFGINPPNFANTLTVQDAFQIQMELTAIEE
jgi:polyisoprenoid-binding protein YceI